MRKFLKMICMACVTLMFTQCATHDPGPLVPVDINGTIKIRHSDYREESYWNYYPSESTTLTVEGNGNEVYIKGFFKKYPEARIKGKVKRDYVNIESGPIADFVFSENGQVIAEDNGKPVYFHCGNLSYWYPHDASSVTLQFTFEPMSEIKVFQVTEDGKGFEDELGCYFPTFWYNDDPEGTVRFYSTWKDGKVEGTGFPEFDCVANFGFDY